METARAFSKPSNPTTCQSVEIQNVWTKPTHLKNQAVIKPWKEQAEMQVKKLTESTMFSKSSGTEEIRQIGTRNLNECNEMQQNNSPFR